MNIIIKRLSGESYDLEKLDVVVRDFIVPLPNYLTNTETIEGMDGVVDLGTTIGPRILTGVFYFKAPSVDLYAKKRDEVFDLFESTEAFYIIEEREQSRRWLVKVNGSDGIDQQRFYGFFNVEFINFSGYAESIGTTLQSATFEHLDLPVTYTDYKDIRAVKFRVYNAGKAIDPRSIHNFLKITYKGESKNLRIKNNTTGDLWAYNGSSNANDTIVLEGIRSTKNSLSIFRDTNKQLITLAHGWNDFVISGAPDAQRYAVQAHMPRKEIPSELKPNPITFEFKYKF